MYAHVTTAEAPPGAAWDLNRVIRREVVPALRCEQGFSGALVLFDGSTLLVVVYWETEEQAARARLRAVAGTTQLWEVCGRG